MPSGQPQRQAGGGGVRDRHPTTTTAAAFIYTGIHFASQSNKTSGENFRCGLRKRAHTHPSAPCTRPPVRASTGEWALGRSAVSRRNVFRESLGWRVKRGALYLRTTRRWAGAGQDRARAWHDAADTAIGPRPRFRRPRGPPPRRRHRRRRRRRRRSFSPGRLINKRQRRVLCTASTWPPSQPRDSPTYCSYTRVSVRPLLPSVPL